DQIDALVKQGDATGAAQVAVESFSKAMDDRTQDIAKNQGIIVQGWRDIKNIINGAMEAIGSFGAVSSPAQRPAALQARKAAAANPADGLANLGGELTPNWTGSD